MKKKIVLEFSIMTVGECSSPVKEMEVIESRYFDPSLYENTVNVRDDHPHSFRRVFDFDEKGKKEFLELCKFLKKNTIPSKDCVIERLSEFYGEMIDFAESICNGTCSDYSDFIDSNFFEIDYSMRVINTDIKKIKKIIYEDE